MRKLVKELADPNTYLKEAQSICGNWFRGQESNLRKPAYETGVNPILPETKSAQVSCIPTKTQCEE